MARPRLQSVHPVPWASDLHVAATRDAEGRPLIRLQTLGAAVIQCGESRVGPSAGVLFALLLRLTHAAGMQLSRDALLDTLWPEQPEGRRRGSLRQALYKLRGTGVRVALDGDAVRLDHAQVVRTFSIARTLEHFDRDVTRGNEPFGPFLPGYLPPFASLDEWLTQEREAVHADVRRVLVAQLRGRRERADWTGAEAFARWLLQFDVLHEDATLTIAECTMMAGAKTEAIAIIDRYLAEVGPSAGGIRLPAEKLRRRFVEATRGRLSFAPTERHFVGREEEVAALTIAMRRARWHDGSAVLLYGPPGIGKTRLTHEMSKVATIEGVRELRVGCRESDRERTLSMMLDLLPELLASPGALGCAPESMVTLRRLVPSVSADTVETDVAIDAPVDGAAAGVSMDVAGGSTPIGPADPSTSESCIRKPVTMAASIRRAIVDLVSAVCDERPVLLVVDDVNWIDADSWDVLADIIDRVQSTRLVLFITSREPHARATRPERVPTLLVVRELKPLSLASGKKLARLIGDDLSAPISEDLCQWFIEASEGSPLFLRSLVNHWIETGEAGGVPPTLAQAIERRLAKLSPDALRMLQAISLLGENASVERLIRILDLRTNEAMNAIEQLERSGALAKSTTSYIVAHDLIGVSASRRLSVLTGGVLHERIADVLTADIVGGEPAAFLFQIADHLRSSSSSSRFADFIQAHINSFTHGGSPARSLALLDEAISSRSELRLSPTIAHARSRLNLECGEYTQSLRDRPGRVELPPLRSITSNEAADDALTVIDSAYRADDLADRDELLKYAFELTKDGSLASNVRLRAAEIALVIAANTCNESIAKGCFDATRITVTVESSDTRAQRIALLYHAVFGDRSLAREIACSLVEHATSQPASTQKYHDLCRAGYALRCGGTRDEVLDALGRGFETALELNLPRLAQYPAWQIAAVHMDAGATAEASRWNSALEQLFESDNDGVSTNFVPAHFCRVAIASGDAVGARRFHAEATKRLPRSPVAVAAAFATALDIGVLLMDEEWRPDPDQLHIAGLRHAATCERVISDFFTSVLARAHLRRGEVDSARGILHRFVNGQRRETLPHSVELTIALELV